MRENHDDRVKEWWPMDGRLKVKSEDDAAVDDKNLAKSLNQMPCHLASYILGHSKRLMNNGIRKRDGFYSNNIY